LKLQPASQAAGRAAELGIPGWGRKKREDDALEEEEMATVKGGRIRIRIR
jgi:hypothetical protein